MWNGGIVQWLSANPGLAIAIALVTLGVLVKVIQATFYAWYLLLLVVAFVTADIAGDRLYFYTFLLGMITAFAEIIGKFRDEPLKSLQTPQALFYHLLNGGIAVFALKVYFLNFGATTSDVEKLKAVLVAGLGSMLLMRSKFFNINVGGEDVSFGPEQIIKVFFSFMEGAIAASARWKATVSPSISQTTWSTRCTAWPISYGTPTVAWKVWCTI